MLFTGYKLHTYTFNYTEIVYSCVIMIYIPTVAYTFPDVGLKVKLLKHNSTKTVRDSYNNMWLRESKQQSITYVHCYEKLALNVSIRFFVKNLSRVRIFVSSYKMNPSNRSINSIRNYEEFLKLRKMFYVKIPHNTCVTTRSLF